MDHTLQRGFTLLELMVVMIIMGVLATIGIQSYITSQIKGRDANRKANLKSIQSALELYYNDNSRYPPDDGNGHIMGCNGGVGLVPTPAPVSCTVKQVWQDVNGTVYMPQLPADPLSTQVYYYRATLANGVYSKYQLYGYLENSQDPQIMTPSGIVPPCGTNGSTSVSCNYGVSSPNMSP